MTATDLPLPAGLSATTAARQEAAEDVLRGLGSTLVALSGGVDSALVVTLAARTLGAERVLAAMGVGPAYPAEDVEAARAAAAHAGVPLLEVATGQTEDPAFLRNDAARCFHCRRDLHATLGPLAREHGLAAVCDGTNADDLRGSDRPGLRAVRAARVVTPLADAGMTKADVRAVARALGVPTWDRPQQACLSSRIPRGTPITLERLARVEQAERWLRTQGVSQVRVREHGDVARIEVPAEEITRLAADPLRSACAAALRALGYRAVSLDLEPFATGRLSRIDGGGAPAE